MVGTFGLEFQVQGTLEEMNYAQGDFDKAAVQYEASIKAAQEHKLIHEEALASELAGNFFLERGQRQRSRSHLKHASECYEKWGAFVISRRIEDNTRDELARISLSQCQLHN